MAPLYFLRPVLLWCNSIWRMVLGLAAQCKTMNELQPVESSDLQGAALLWSATQSIQFALKGRCSATKLRRYNAIARSCGLRAPIATGNEIRARLGTPNFKPRLARAAACVSTRTPCEAAPCAS